MSVRPAVRVARAVLTATVGALLLYVVGIALLGPSGGDSTAARAPEPALTLTPGLTPTPTPTPVAPPAAPRSRSSTFTLLQTNLCLSGLAGCYEDTSYPAVLTEAAMRIRSLAPDAVTVTEGCRRDMVSLGRRLGYDVRFAPVIYAGTELGCVEPAGRGLFGDAVLTKAPVVAFETRAFTAQADLEERRWLCATTRDDLDVCTAHLETPHTAAAAAARDAQCAELRGVLASRSSRAFVFGGDLNRRASCAPSGAWSLTDSAAGQDPGIQHGYGSAALRGPTVEVVPMRYSDHDLLVVRAALSPAAPPGDGAARRDGRREPPGRGSARR